MRINIRARPAGTWRRNDVVLTSMRRNYVASTSIRRHCDVMCLLGGCSKLTTSLVNVSLKFQKLISKMHQYFCWKNVCKSFSHFFNKNISVFGYKVIKHLTSWPLNELVKLTMLWTTGPRCKTNIPNIVWIACHTKMWYIWLLLIHFNTRHWHTSTRFETGLFL